MRYLLLLLLNLPVILLALMSIVTQYKMNRMSRERFRSQILLWSVALIVIIGSFPVYNLMIGKALLDSAELSLFDIFEITVIVVLVYSLNNQRQRVERNEKTLRDLHQELSIKLSKK